MWFSSPAWIAIQPTMRKTSEIQFPSVKAFGHYLWRTSSRACWPCAREYVMCCVIFKQFLIQPQYNDMYNQYSQTTVWKGNVIETLWLQETNRLRKRYATLFNQQWSMQKNPNRLPVHSHWCWKYFFWLQNK